MAIEAINIATTVSLGGSLTAVSGANSKAAWTELVASSSFAADAIIIAPFQSGASGDFLYDIATGAASSETVIIENFTAMRNTNNTHICASTVFPISIASGSRVAARYQCTSASGTSRFAAYLIKKDNVAFHECTSAVTYGANTTDSGGTSLNPGATTNTKGAYSQLTASTTADIKWLSICIANQNNQARNATGWLVDIATGGAGAETVVVPNVMFVCASGAEGIGPIIYPPIPIEIPSGSRIAARAQAQVDDATDRLIDVVVIGFDGTATGGGGGGSFHASIR